MGNDLDNRELRRLKNSDQGTQSEIDALRIGRLDQRLQTADQLAVDQKLTDEQQRLAALQKQAEPQSIEEAPWFQYVQDRVQLENELAKPPNPGVPAEAQRAHEAALLHEIAVLKQQHANDALAKRTKNDSDIYLAEKRLSKL
jgi:hypothetical protein